MSLQTEIPTEVTLSCDDEVRGCVEALTSIGDTESCGRASAVLPCLNGLWSLPASPSKFAADLMLWLSTWYGDHAADVASSGGRALLEAQAGVHTAAVYEITAPGDDPEAHDPAKFIVYAHPDPVWPGSDRVWFGAYDRTSGQLVRIYDFE